MDAAYVSKGVERCDVDSDAHEFVDVTAADQFVHVYVFAGEASGSYLLVCKELHLPGGVKRQGFSFPAESGPHYLKEDEAACGFFFPVFGLFHVRKKLVEYSLVTVEKPPFSRFLAKKRNVFFP